MAVIELLRVRTAPGCRSEFLARDADVWTPALAAHEGFVSKEVWVSHDDPNLVTLVIRWSSMAQWKSFPSDLLAELDAKMEGVQVSLSAETYDEVPDYYAGPDAAKPMGPG
jgi:uncharacterized protein (TIGR03792 family)